MLAGPYGDFVNIDLEQLLSAADRGDPVRVIYHHPCPDGFAAAYCAWTRLGSRATYIPYGHDDPPRRHELHNAFVVMCDCCYKRPDLLSARSMARSMLVLDHHKSSMDQCGDLDYCTFDMMRSGAGMAWDFFNPGQPRPLMIDCVEDRDLELNLIAQTRAFCAKLDTMPTEFSAWDRVAKLEGEALTRFMREGHEMLAQFESQAQAITASAQPCMFNGRRAYILNAPYRFASRCGAILCALPGCEMAAIWSSTDLRNAKLSLRADPASGCDVAAMAVALGGGGHAVASGAMLPLSTLADMAQPSSWDNIYKSASPLRDPKPDPA
jgi:hypothetical protein